MVLSGWGSLHVVVLQSFQVSSRMIPLLEGDEATDESQAEVESVVKDLTVDV